MNKIENREYPEEMIKLGGFTSIPNAIIGQGFNESVYVKMILIYMLSKPAEWVFYYSIIEKETGISKSTVYKTFTESMHKYMDVQYVSTGKYGSGFIVNFSKLYTKCYEIGVEKQKSSAAKKQESALKNQFVHQKDNTFRAAERSFRFTDTSVRETSTTNTDTNTESNNTKEQYYLTNAKKDRKDFQSVDSLGSASPNGSRRKNKLDKTEETDLPVDTKNQDYKKESDSPEDQSSSIDSYLPVVSEEEEERKEFDVLLAAAGITKENIGFQSSEIIETNKFASYILESLFADKNYTPPVKLGLLTQLQDKPAADLKLIIDSFAQWKFWCQNIAADYGLTKLKASDYGLPLLLTKSIYSKFMTYLKQLKQEELVAAQAQKKQEENEIELKRQVQLKQQKIKFVNTMTIDEKRSVLLKFRFDLCDEYKSIYENEIEEILRTNKLPCNDDVEELYDILARKYESHLYEGRADVLAMRDKLCVLSDCEILDKLKLFNFLSIHYYSNVKEGDLKLHAKNRHINWDYKMMYDIIFNVYPPDNYREEKKVVNFEETEEYKEFADSLICSLNEE